VERAISLPFFSQELRIPLLGPFPCAFDFYSDKVRLLTFDTKQPLREADMMLTVVLLRLVIGIAKHDASFKQ
jgi:hypothetical protein